MECVVAGYGRFHEPLGISSRCIQIHRGWVCFFLKEKLNVPKSEYYLPSVVSSYRERNQKVNVLVAEDKWYGVTYKEDKPAVVASIGELIDKGYYDGI